MRQKIFPPHRIRQKPLFRALCVIAMSAAFAVLAAASWNARKSPNRTPESITAERQAPAPLNVQPERKLDMLRITLGRTGFEPAEITRPAGRFLLAVNDHSGVRDLVLTLARDNGQRLHTTRMRETPRKHQWRQIVNLEPGRYVLSEANYPEWVCRITLTAN